MGTWQTTFSQVLGSDYSDGDVSTNEHTVTVDYLGVYSDNSATPLDAESGTGVPAYGSQYGSANLYLMNKHANRDAKNPGIWTVTLTYKTLASFAQQPKLNATSTKWAILSTITPYPVEVPLQKDPRTGALMVNCIGEAIKPAPTKIIFDKQLNISFTTTALLQSDINACEEKTNPSAVNLPFGAGTLTFAADTMLFKSTPAQETYDVDGNKIVNMNYMFLIRKDTWLGQYPNLSYNYAGSSGAIPMKILDARGDPLSEPQYLDDAGFPLPAGGTITIAGAAASVWPNGTNNGYWTVAQANSTNWNNMMAEIQA
jgi:hypothetical protein